ncbi:MAG: hypothetical protein JO099_25325 [Acidobacteriia bacterium]|nr:hypothetical protein [Terriglobia bacterium]
MSPEEIAHRPAVSSWIEEFTALWARPLLDRTTARVTLLAAVFAICAIRAYYGLSRIVIYTHDAFVYLNGAERVLHGQRPHVDFYSGLGALNYLLTAAGLLLSHGRPSGISYGQAVFGLLAGFAAYRLARPRLTALACIVYTLFVTLLVVAPFNIGEAFDAISVAMLYNREGYALLALVLLESACAPEANPRREEVIGGVISGAAAAAAAFLKITYLPCALLLLVALIGVRRQSQARWIAVGCGMLAIATPILIYIHGFHPMWTDLRLVAGAKRIDGYQARMKLAGAISASIVPLAALAASCLVLLHKSGRGLFRLRNLAIAAACVTVIGLLTLVSNWQDTGMPLDTAFCIILASGIARVAGLAGYVRTRALVLIWACVLISDRPIADLVGLLNAARYRNANRPPDVLAIDAPVVANIWSNEQDYVEYVNQGLRMVRRNLRPEDNIAVLDFSDPFTYSLQLPLTKTGAAWLVYNDDFNEQYHPLPKQVFADARLAIVSKKNHDFKRMMAVYGSYLSQHYRLVEQSDWWSLYRRNREAAREQFPAAVARLIPSP